jgi:RNA polymerase sigma factor (sigma-70 family)
MMPLGLSEQMIAAGLPWKEVERMARRLVALMPSRGVIDEDDLASVGLVAACKSNRPFAAARGAMIDDIRRHFGRTNGGRISRQVPKPLEAAVAARDPSPTPEEQFLGDEIHRVLMQLVEKLPAKQRAVIQALYFDGKSMTRWASEVGCQTPAVSKLHGRALAMLLEGMGTFRPGVRLAR